MVSYWVFSIPLILLLLALYVSHTPISAVVYRCSGDFSQCKQTKYVMGLPGLTEQTIREQLMADINEMERAVAAAPGMYGRIWYGQGLAFDEAYQILQDHICLSLVCAYRLHM